MSFNKKHLVTFVILIFVAIVQPYQEKSKLQKNKEYAISNSTEVIKAMPTGFRLPDTVEPIHYFLRLQPFVNGNFSVHGYIEIKIKILKDTSDIIMHMADIVTHNETLEVSEVGIEKNSRLIPVKSQSYFPETEFYVISLWNELKASKIYVIKFSYTGLINDKLKGLYRSSYQDAEGNKRWLAVTHFQPTATRLAFPCFDEPALKAEVTLELVRQANMSSISNMPLFDTIQAPGQPGWLIDQFERSVKMSTYLVAFMVSSFSFASERIMNETLMRVWSREESIAHADYALRTGVDTLLFFENFFRIPYPLPKMDMVALPDFNAGAMENWGLITYREAYLIYDDSQATLLNKDIIGYIIAHELAHQWFGNIVTPYWWTDLWLNEGFATYMGKLGQDAVEPSFKIMEKFVTGPLRRALIADSLDSSHPISIPVEHPDEIREIFDAISYSKGASLIRMMSHFLTEETFRKGITNYLRKFAYSVAKQDDLWEYITEQAIVDGTLPLNLTVKEIMDTWTLQRGYPVISVSVNEDGTASVKQERFLIGDKSNTTDDQEFKWWIPITFTRECQVDFNDTLPVSWMSPHEEIKEVSGMPNENQWVVFNVLQTGFYRVNYERSNWKRLNQQLHKDHLEIHTVSRAQLIGDAFQLAKAGMLSYDIPLDMVSYLSKDDDLTPLECAVYELNYLTSMLKYTDLYDDFKTYVLSLLTPHYDRIGFDNSFEDTFVEQSKRSLILPKVCYFEYSPCIERTKELYQMWMEDPKNDSIITPAVRSTVYCNAIREGGHNEWKFALDMYIKTDAISEKLRLLSALGCTSNTTEKLMLIELIFVPDSPVRKQDAKRAFGSVIRDKESSLLVWNYIKENWDKIYEYFGSKRSPIALLISASQHIRSFEELKERDDFIASKPVLTGAGTRKLEQSRERIVADIHWLNRNLQTIQEWFYDNGYRSHVQRTPDSY